ncbi:hypothetical protein HPB49_009835 [Dermacentor silvarum]|uniref:Uncharacterized protein n=1 Tax=Dermacentor silvarum TaxID=543639 RepID=A0ACB8DBZ7_DERSI|nr:hypothetical protein HPB49_009835 [Dermacentor silvarum]
MEASEAVTMASLSVSQLRLGDATEWPAFRNIWCRNSGQRAVDPNDVDNERRRPRVSSRNCSRSNLILIGTAPREATRGTGYLTIKHAIDPSKRLCRCCNQRPETTFHILQECPSVHLARAERHNFITTNVVRMMKERNPQAIVQTETLLVTKDNDRLKPDLVVEDSNQVTIVDFAVTGDAK